MTVNGRLEVPVAAPRPARGRHARSAGAL